MLDLIVPLQSIVVLRITMRSAFVAPAVIQPRMDDWVNDSNADILPVHYNIMPAYIYLSPDSSTAITITLQIPVVVKDQDVIRSSIHFSGFQSCTVPIKITLEETNEVADKIYEHKIDLTLPMSDHKKGSKHTNGVVKPQQVAKVLAGMAALEVLPSKWLVSELVLAMLEKGLIAAEKEENKIFINKLTRTRLFKNGVLVISGSHFIHWTMIGLSVSSGLQGAMGKKEENSGMLRIWEQWLLNLAGDDIEAADYESIDTEFPAGNNYEAIVKKIGMEPEKWLLYIVLGLMQVSPRLHTIITQICAQVRDIKPKQSSTKRRKTKKVLNEKGSLQR